MIYFIDEDIAQLRPFRAELTFRGYEVTTLPDADSAFSVLVKANPESLQLAIIDVMLAANPDERASRYQRSNTNNFHKTGLLLLEDLIHFNPTTFPKHAAFLTHATNNDLIAEIDSVVHKHHIPFLRKRDFESALAFGERIETILKEIMKVKK